MGIKRVLFCRCLFTGSPILNKIAGPELIQLSEQSVKTAQVMPLISARHVVTFPATEHHQPLTSTKLVYGHRQMCGNMSGVTCIVNTLYNINILYININTLLPNCQDQHKPVQLWNGVCGSFANIRWHVCYRLFNGEHHNGNDHWNTDARENTQCTGTYQLIGVLQIRSLHSFYAPQSIFQSQKLFSCYSFHCLSFPCISFIHLAKMLDTKKLNTLELLYPVSQ